MKSSLWFRCALARVKFLQRHLRMNYRTASAREMATEMAVVLLLGFLVWYDVSRLLHYLDMSTGYTLQLCIWATTISIEK